MLSSLSRLRIASAIDIGANVGQFGQLLRGLGYGGHILSLEPLPDAYSRLESAARRDSHWITKRCAVGRKFSMQTINVSKNITSSSLLEVNALHQAAEPTTAVVGTRVVEVYELDDLVRAAALPRPYFLKIDVQGTELDVIAGAAETLGYANLVRVELSFRELYAGAADHIEVLRALRDHGFVPIGVETALEDPRTGDLLQIDLLAARESEV